MNVSPGQRWKLLGLACVGGLTGYLVLNSAGMNPTEAVQAAQVSKPAVVARAAPVQQADPSPQPGAPFPGGKLQTGGVPVRLLKPPAPSAP
jgi:hypothetical protein